MCLLSGWFWTVLRFVRVSWSGFIRLSSSLNHLKRHLQKFVDDDDLFPSLFDWKFQIQQIKFESKRIEVRDPLLIDYIHTGLLTFDNLELVELSITKFCTVSVIVSLNSPSVSYCFIPFGANTTLVKPPKTEFKDILNTETKVSVNNNADCGGQK